MTAFSRNLQSQLMTASAGLSVELSIFKINSASLLSGIETSLAAEMPKIAASMSAAFAGINLAPVGNNIGKTLSEGIMSGIDSSGLIDRIYATINAKWLKDLSRAGA
jgi:hypothetical protein